MIGFIADYESGTIKLQDEELSAGEFYSRDNMPEIPKKLSIARQMIDAWLEGKVWRKQGLSTLRYILLRFYKNNIPTFY